LRKASLLVALLALACSSELDWRELRSTEGGFVALMPAKPRYEVPTLGAPAVTMHLWSARAANSIFGVGYGDYPRVDAATLDSTQDVLVKNIGGRVLEEKPLLQGGLPGREFVAESGATAQGAPVVSGNACTSSRSSASGTPAAADIDLFLSSFQLLGCIREEPICARTPA
jgi:hypothetical protein